MARAPAPAEPTDGAQSVRRALAILRLVAAGQDRGVRLTDVATMSGLTPPTVHRFLKVLMEETAVEQDPATRRYRIGHEITLLGLARTGGVSIRGIAEPYLAALAAAAGHTVFLSVRHGADSVCIARHLGSDPIQVLSIDVGARRPLGASVSGIALLAGLPVAEARALTQRNAQRLQGAGRTVTQVLAAAEACRTHGHTYAPEGVMPGTSALAVPLRDATGGVVGAISIAALADRLPRERVRGTVARMHEQATLVCQRLGEIERARSRRR
ncbi:IclR family transcriptional regulator [Ramlibacter sp.]|uniref:IclR family transcriptional regulator n=1 Tax=Ramlibacter sp. TaxID=1917967 RepID=UPI0035AE6A9B